MVKIHNQDIKISHERLRQDCNRFKRNRNGFIDMNKQLLYFMFFIFRFTILAVGLIFIQIITTTIVLVGLVVMLLCLIWKACGILAEKNNS